MHLAQRCRQLQKLETSEIGRTGQKCKIAHLCDAGGCVCVSCFVLCIVLCPCLTPPPPHLRYPPTYRNPPLGIQENQVPNVPPFGGTPHNKAGHCTREPHCWQACVIEVLHLFQRRSECQVAFASWQDAPQPQEAQVDLQIESTLRWDHPCIQAGPEPTWQELETENLQCKRHPPTGRTPPTYCTTPPNLSYPPP